MHEAIRGAVPTWSVAIGLTFASLSSQAQTVFDNLNGPATAGYSFSQANTQYGSLLNLAQPGKLSGVTFSLFNNADSGGSIVSGTMHLSLYDATGGYSGGTVQLPLLGQVTVPLNLSAQPLAAGFYNTFQSSYLGNLQIQLPATVLLLQRFEITSGTSTRYGIASGLAPSIGSSPGTYFVSNDQNPPGLYTGTGGQAVYPLYQVTVVPEPESVAAMAGLALVGWAAWHRRSRAKA